MNTSPTPLRNAPSPSAKPLYDPLNPEPSAPHRPSTEGATTEKKSPKPNKRLTQVIEWGILVLAIFLILLLRHEVWETAIVTSGSMEATLQVNDHILVDHRNTLSGNWQRGDIVFFDVPESWGGANDQMLVKRVIGLPGESVELRAGVVYINGKPLNEPYLKEKPKDQDMMAFQIPQSEYWVMGDNRNNSDDSRANGPVPDELINGRGLRVLWPWGDAGALPKPDYGF